MPDRDMGQPAPDVLIAAGFTRLIEDLRDDVREDLRDIRDEIGRSEERVTKRVNESEQGVTAHVAAVEGRLNARLEDQRQDSIEYTTVHGDLHEHEATDRREAHTAFYTFMERAKLDQARKDGALGVTRFVFALVSTNAGALTKVLLAVAAVLLAATGQLHVNLGGQP